MSRVVNTLTATMRRPPQQALKIASTAGIAVAHRIRTAMSLTSSSSPWWSPCSASHSSSSRPCFACRLFSTTHNMVDSNSSDGGSNQDSHSDFKPVTKRSVLSGASSSSSLISSDISSHRVFLYMKGEPSLPKCGFSANVVRILQHLNAAFASRDVLADNELREAVKGYSDWPTLPQLYINGEFVGGSDIITQMFKSGELEKMLMKAGAITSNSATAVGGAGRAAPDTTRSEQEQ